MTPANTGTLVFVVFTAFAALTYQNCGSDAAKSGSLSSFGTFKIMTVDCTPADDCLHGYIRAQMLTGANMGSQVRVYDVVVDPVASMAAGLSPTQWSSNCQSDSDVTARCSYGRVEVTINETTGKQRSVRVSFNSTPEDNNVITLNY